MTNTNQPSNHSLEIFIGELMTDQELCDSFLRDPEQTLDSVSDWALPISESELRSIRRSSHRLWDRVVEELETRLRPAA